MTFASGGVAPLGDLVVPLKDCCSRWALQVLKHFLFILAVSATGSGLAEP